MTDRLYGEQATISRVLAKVEIAARRSALIGEAGQQMIRFAEQLAKIEKDMWNND